jgi:hypothetical protein
MAWRKLISNTFKFITIPLIFIGILFAFVLVALGLFFFSTLPVHNLALWGLDRALDHSVEYLPNSTIVERHRFLGTRYTDISECTYVVGQIRSTQIPVEEVLRQYQGKTLHSPGFSHSIPINVVILDDTPSTSLADPTDNWAYDFIRNTAVSSADITYYLVYLNEPGKSWWGDYRCIE